MRGSAREDRERWDTGGLTANNDHTCGVEGRSVPHTHRGGVPQTETKQLSNKRLHPKDGRITERLFFTAVQFSVQSSETAKPDVDGYTACMVLLFMRGLTAFSERQW